MTSTPWWTQLNPGSRGKNLGKSYIEAITHRVPLVYENMHAGIIMPNISNVMESIIFFLRADSKKFLKNLKP